MPNRRYNNFIVPVIGMKNLNNRMISFIHKYVGTKKRWILVTALIASG